MKVYTHFIKIDENDGTDGEPSCNLETRGIV